VEYTLVLTVKNQAGLTSAKNVTLTVPPTVPPNSPPTANAGQNQAVTLANDLTVTLNGSGSDTEGGHIVSKEWTCSEYTPAQGVTSPYTTGQVTALIQIASENESESKDHVGVEATVALRKAGTYKFQFTVTDNDGAPGIATVMVIVEPKILDSKDISVTFPGFYPDSTSPTKIYLNPIYNPIGGWGEYSASDIRYTIEDNMGNNFTALGLSDIDYTRDKFKYDSWTFPWPPPPKFTQIFYDNDNNELGRYSFYLTDDDQVGHFNYILTLRKAIIFSLK
jgi:hypothetical protein